MAKSYITAGSSYSQDQTIQTISNFGSRYMPKRDFSNKWMEKQYKAFSKFKEEYDKRLEDRADQARKKQMLGLVDLWAKKWNEKSQEHINHYRIAMEYADTKAKKIGVGALAAIHGLGDSLKDGLVNAISKATKAMVAGVEEYLGAYSKYKSGIDARLQGSGKDFRSVSDLVSRAIGGSPLVSQTKVMENLSGLVSQGIAYNVEQRAFLQTMKDKIAETFDAANGTLLRLIRIQQADSTAARLGLEANLLQFFNSTFKDSSYLNSLSDTVASTILGASSQLGRNGSLAFESTVQSWLGSLYSVGVSEGTIQKLATGLNYLGTGNISALAGDTALQNLLIMASQNAGVDYAQILTGGLTAQTADRLLGGLVDYAKTLAASDNQIIKSKYAEIFGIAIDDLTAMLNLEQYKGLTESISKNILTYQSAIDETTKQLAAVSNRITLKEKIDTVFQNVMSSAGEGIGNSAAGYTAWILNDLVEKATGGINIPFITAMGTGVDVNANVNQLVKLGIVGISTIAKSGEILGGLFRSGDLMLDKWNAEDSITRGAGFNGVITNTGITNSTSQTQYIGNSNESDIYGGTLQAATENLEQTDSIINQNNKSLIEDNVQIIKNVVELIEQHVSSIKNGMITNFGG